MELQKKHWFVSKRLRKDKNQYILLEPAGYIPYFSGLKAIDEVGLVDKEIQTEIKKDKANYWKNTVEKRKPKVFIGSKNLFEGKRWKFLPRKLSIVEGI